MAVRLLFLSVKTTSTAVKREIGFGPRLNIVDLSQSGMIVAGRNDDISVISIFT